MRRSLVALVAVLAGLPPAAAQNLATNGDFTADLSGWMELGPFAPNTGSTAWDADSGSALAGAVRIQISDNDNSGGGGMTRRQCIDVDTGTVPLPWDFGARGAFVVAAGCEHFVGISHFSGAGCTGTQGASSVAVAAGTVAGMLDGAPTLFTRIEGSQPLDPMPGGSPTASVYLSVSLVTNSGTDVCEAVYDSAYFGGDGTTPVELQSFGVE